jgi:hypothetical protein
MPSNKSFLPFFTSSISSGMLNRIQHAPVKGFPYNYVFHSIYQARIFIQTMLNRMKSLPLSGSLMRATGLIFINQMLLSIRQVLFLQPRLRMKGFILFFTLTIWIGRFAFSISGTCLYNLVTLVIRKIQPHTLCTVPELLSQ